jgi:hypothetical protein
MADVAYELAFRAGFDESIQEEVLEPSAAFTTLQNGRYDKIGGYTKRRGYTALGTTRLDGTSRSAGHRLLTNASQFCTINGTELDTLAEGADSSWSPKGRVPEATYRHLELPSVGLGDEHSVDDVVVCGDVAAAIYLFSNVIVGVVDLYTIVTVFDVATGAVIRAPEGINVAAIGGTALTVHLATYGAYIIAITADFDSDEITASYLDTTSRATISTGWVLIGTIANNLGPVHINVASQSDRVAVVYANNGGGASQLTVKTFNISGVIETVNINTSSLLPAGPSLSEGGATLWVAWAEEVAGGPPTVTNFKVLGLNPSDIDGTALATVATVISTSRAGGEGAGVTWLVSTGATTGVLYAINENTFDCDGINVRAFSTSAGATTAVGTTAKRVNSVPAGKPFYRGGRVYMPLSSSNLEELVLCDVTPPNGELTWRPVAVPVNRGTFAMHTSNPRARCAVSGDNTYLSVFMVVKAGTSDNGIFGAALVEYDFANPYRWKPAGANGSTFLSGGITSIFDGRRVFEAGFLCRPPPIVIDVATAGSQTFTLGGRSYVATYEEIDADGNWHVSGVSDSVSSGNITTQTVMLALESLTITARDPGDMPGSAGVRIGIWVTTDGGEPPYYRLATVESNPTSEQFLFEDDYAEGDFTSNALLYATGNLPGTGGSSQDHRAPPGLLYHVSYNGMIVGASGKTIYFSSQPIDGEGTWFSPAFSVGGSIDDDVTGMTVQDGSVLIFTRRGVWITAGEPPSDNGSSGGLATPRKLAIDLGCVNANSILTTGVGTFFQSDRGLELLSRGHTVTPIDKFQDQLDTYPVITSAVLDTRNGLAIFSLAESQTDGLASTNGKDVVLDLTRGVWSSIDDKRGGVATQATQDACMAYIDGAWRYTWLGTTGVVYYERDSDDASAHLDGSTWVTQRAITPWLHIAGIQGEQFVDQVLALCKFHTAHDLTISLAFDYSDSFTSTKTFTAAQIGALARQWLVKEMGDHTTSQAVRVKVEDATPSSGSVGTGKGSTWVALTFSGHPHAKVKRTTSAQRGG